MMNSKVDPKDDVWCTYDLRNASPEGNPPQPSPGFAGSGLSYNRQNSGIKKIMVSDVKSKWEIKGPMDDVPVSPIGGPKIIHMSSGFRIVDGIVLGPENPLKRSIEEDGLYRDKPHEGLYRDDPNAQVPGAPFGFHSGFLPETSRDKERKRKRRLLMSLFALVTIFIIAVSVSSKRPTGGDSKNDDSQTRFQALRDRLDVDRSEPAVRDALEWLQAEDDILSMEQALLEQRYAVVLLYFSTGGAQTWNDDLGFLNASSPVCDWNIGDKGVFCDNTSRDVSRIDLRVNNLSGYLPSDIAKLSQLQHLELWGNSLGGSLPSELSDLKNLQSLLLYDNHISGTLPASIGSIRSLKSLILARNQLEGSIPAEFGGLRVLENLILVGNNCTGTLPPHLGRLSQLEELRVSENQLTGSIPTTFGNLANLAFLDLNSNLIGGGIPSALGSLSTLRHLALGNNPLTGSIPTQLGGLSNLQVLLLQSTQLSGMIPGRLWHLTDLKSLSIFSNPDLRGKIGSSVKRLNLLESLELSRTAMSGTIPTEVGMLTSLRRLDIAHTSFTGTFPTELSLLSSLDYVDLWDTDLVGNLTAIVCDGSGQIPHHFVADCASDAPEVVCECCTKCH